jgi:hypothetical protein
MAKKDNSMLELVVVGLLAAGGIYYYKTKTAAATTAAANTGTIAVTLPAGSAVLTPNTGTPTAST